MRISAKDSGANDWTGIVQIAVSVDAVFGLKQDGTVIYGTKDQATEEKLSYVRDWRDIVSIAAGSYGKLIGLHANGRVVGLHDWENDWRNIVGIAGGDFFYGVDRQGALYTRTVTNRTPPLFRYFGRPEDEKRESRTSGLAFLRAAETL